MEDREEFKTTPLITLDEDINFLVVVTSTLDSSSEFELFWTKPDEKVRHTVHPGRTSHMGVHGVAGRTYYIKHNPGVYVGISPDGNSEYTGEYLAEIHGGVLRRNFDYYHAFFKLKEENERARLQKYQKLFKMEMDVEIRIGDRDNHYLLLWPNSKSEICLSCWIEEYQGRVIVATDAGVLSLPKEMFGKE